MRTTTLTSQACSSYTTAQICSTLNRPAILISKAQATFELPRFEAGYPAAYLAFLSTILKLRRFGISEERTLKLWHLEKKLLVLLHADSTRSPTWFLDSCGMTTHRNQRLLLTNYDIGRPLPAPGVQLGLDFAPRLPELFTGGEMGEDALRVLNQILDATHAIRADIAAELPHLRSTAIWGAHLLKGTS